MMSVLGRAAVAYAEQGWAVFPLLDRDKRPRFAGAYKRASSDRAQVERWWRAFPQANIGLATGSASGLWVLDVDGTQGEDSYAELVACEEQLPDTRMVRTTKGWHLYWRLGGQFDPGRKIGARPGLDVIGGSGYLLAPPSVHPSASVYAWVNPSTDIAESPPWLLERLSAKSHPEPLKEKWIVQRSGAGYLEGVLRRAERDIISAAEGTRNKQLFRSSVWALSVAEGIGGDTANALGRLMQAARFVGLGEIEIRRTLDSASAQARANPRRD